MSVCPKYVGNVAKTLREVGTYELVQECWSAGVLECWSAGVQLLALLWDCYDRCGALHYIEAVTGGRYITGGRCVTGGRL